MDAHRTDVPEQEDGWLIEQDVAAWAARPFARTFDLISAEYGWTDDQILDLPLVRMRQIREVIFERRAHDRRQALLDKETEVRTLAQYVAATAQHDGAQQMIDSASQIQFVRRPKRLREIPMAMARKMFGA